MSASALSAAPLARPEETLDPADWEAMRRLGHRMMDDAIDYLRGVRERPVWQSPPDAVRTRLREPLPREGWGAERTYEAFKELVLPYPNGNIHPRFWGWVMGTGSPFAAMAELMAATMNCNVTGFDDSASLVEDQVIEWFREAFGFPPGAGGLMVSGGSMANFVGLAAARHARAGFDVRAAGQAGAPHPLTLYASREAHNSVAKAVELMGLGRAALRLLEVDGDYRMDLSALEQAIAADRAAGLHPFCVVGSAGTVNTGATDDLDALATLAAREGLWFHVDGAVGALTALCPELRPKLRGLERADSVAFDLHKWGYIPYEAGCVIVREKEQGRHAFRAAADYLVPHQAGVSGRSDRFADLGLELSRGFKALKVWMSLKAEGADKLGRLMLQNTEQARHLARRVRQSPELELLAPAPLNIVCFRYAKGGDLDRRNERILIRLHREGIAVPSYTRLGGRYALRVAITNHRTRREDLDHLVDEVVRLGREPEA